MEVVISRGRFNSPSKKLVARLQELGMTISDDPKSNAEIIRDYTNKGYYLNDRIGNDQRIRTDPRLIKAVREIGSLESQEGWEADMANGYTKDDIGFIVISIPDDVKFHIEDIECAPGEVIVENHRTWDPRGEKTRE